MDNKPLVSVIVPCYNLSQYVIETLESVAAQTYTSWECIIVNDGSTDNSEQVITQWCKGREQFRYIYKSNGGVSAARNHAISHSHGKYILPLDADDIIAPKYLELAVEALEQNSTVGIVYCKAETFTGNKRKPWNLPEFNIETMLRGNIIFNCGMYRREDYDKTPKYNENRMCGYEDWDYWLSLLQLGVTVHRIDQTLFYYRTLGNSRSNGIKGSKRWESIFLIVNDHLPLYDRHSEHNSVLEIAQQMLRSKEYRAGNRYYTLLRKLKKHTITPLANLIN